MGRHVTGLHARPRSPLVFLAPAAVVVLLVAGLVWWLAGSDGDAEAGACAPSRTVALTVAPEIGPLVEEVLGEPVELADGGCAAVEVSTRRPLQTVGDLAALAPDALPDVWVPDSSLWASRVSEPSLEDAGSLGTSPVVLATSRAAAEELGWTGAPPQWAAALTSGRPVVMGDLTTSTDALSALTALHASLGGDADADDTVAEAVLAAARGPAMAPEDALAVAAGGAVDAPVVPVSEQRVVAANRDVDDPALVAVYPAEGSPALDYPVLRVGGADQELRPAVDAVVRALTAPAAQDAARRAGLRAADGTAFEDAGAATGTREEAPEVLPVDPAASSDLLAQLTSLAAPSRLLAVVDVSTSMAEPVGNGTRATLARDSALSALALLPETTAMGLWFFAAELDGGQDWEAVVPTRTLDTVVDGTSQAELLTEQFDALPFRLGGSGTGLHDTTLAAVRAARADFDAAAVNRVVLVTDGANQDRDGISLDELVRTLEAEADPERPVEVIGIALGADADLAALERIAEATGGAAHSAVEETDLRTVLFDVLRERD
jgi:Ca-activated chloride channel homolog